MSIGMIFEFIHFTEFLDASLTNAASMYDNVDASWKNDKCNIRISFVDFDDSFDVLSNVSDKLVLIEISAHTLDIECTFLLPDTLQYVSSLP